MFVLETIALCLCKCIDEQPEVSTNGIQNWTGAAAFFVLLYFCFCLLWRPGGGNTMDQIVGHEVLRCIDLFLRGGPSEDRLDFLDDIL